MWSLFFPTLGLLAPGASGLSCKPRPGGTPVPLGVFVTSAPANSLDKKIFDAKPAIKLALNYIQNHSCILDGFKLELIYKDTQVSWQRFLVFQPFLMIQLDMAYHTHILWEPCFSFIFPTCSICLLSLIVIGS